MQEDKILYVYVRPARPRYGSSEDADEFDAPMKVDAFDGDWLVGRGTAADRVSRLVSMAIDRLSEIEDAQREYMPALADFTLAAIDRMAGLYSLLEPDRAGNIAPAKTVGAELDYCFDQARAIASSSEYLLTERPAIGRRAWKLPLLLGVARSFAGVNGVIEPTAAFIALREEILLKDQQKSGSLPGIPLNSPRTKVKKTGPRRAR